MGLLDRIFKGKDDSGRDGAGGSQFNESEPDEDGDTLGTRRRELIHVVLRDAMRLHGIPSDWLDCRILSVASRRRAAGMHVQFIVRDGEDRLLEYIHPFEDSFRSELAKFESRASDWLFSLAWEFAAPRTARPRARPAASAWGAAAAGAGAGAVGGAGADVAAAQGAAASAAADLDSDVEEDLKALFAIRDAALRDTAPRKAATDRRRGDGPDFEPTQPGFEENDADAR